MMKHDAVKLLASILVAPVASMHMQAPTLQPHRTAQPTQACIWDMGVVIVVYPSLY
jgi:hypothetical protein